MEHKASIHFRPVIAQTSEAHNTREQSLDYVHSELSHKNESIIFRSIKEMEQEIKAFCRSTSGRKLQKNAEPIREAVVNLKSNHTKEDVLSLSKGLESKFGIQVFQIHIHKDEGLKEGSTVKINHHAHLLCRWQDMKTGKTLKLNRQDLSKIQDYVAESLAMERGELKSNTNTERLEAVEYKRQQEEIRLEKIRLEVQELEQKKIQLPKEISNLNLENEKLEKKESPNSSKESLKTKIYNLFQRNTQRLKLAEQTKSLINRLWTTSEKTKNWQKSLELLQNSPKSKPIQKTVFKYPNKGKNKGFEI